MAPTNNQIQKSSQIQSQSPVNSTESIAAPTNHITGGSTTVGVPASKYHASNNFQSSYTNLLPNQDVQTQSPRPSTSSLSSSIFTHGKEKFSLFLKIIKCFF
jgi:hypothetical protein